MDARELLEQKLKRVFYAWQQCQKILTQDETFKELLARYLEAFQHTEQVAQEVGLSAYCARCGERGQGSCCGEDMEFHCEDVLLLLNLACQVSLPKERYYPYGCFFLGAQGCILRVRPLICRNFICPEASFSLGVEKVSLIQQALGPEAEALFTLCEYFRKLCPSL